MSDYVAFDGRIEPLVWGKSIYTILRLPPEVSEALGPAKRVEGGIADHPVNLAPTRAPELEGPFLWAGQSLLDRLGVAPGVVAEVRLRPAPDNLVNTPRDIEAALRADGLTAAREALPPGKRRGLTYKIDTARTAPTRAKRILALMSEPSR